MNMTPDIVSSVSLDLVLFTVVDAQSLSESLWDDSLLSLGNYAERPRSGYALFVVTVPANDDTHPELKNRRLLPGGHLKKTETLAESSHRIVKEQLGLDLKKWLWEVKAFDALDRDIREPKERIISLAYWAMVEFNLLRKYLGGREQVGLELVNSIPYMDKFEQDMGPLEMFDGVCRFGNRTMPSPSSFRAHFKTLSKDLPEGQILGLDHDEMVFFAWRKLRHAFDGRVDPFRYLGNNPLGGEFRISDLHEFTEVCRGERIQKDLFRRQMMSDDRFLRETGKTDKSRAGKPAMLYSPLSIRAEKNMPE
jgi:ADP-ribose pyrophosphatase YjhB (NUDIX family)